MLPMYSLFPRPVSKDIKETKFKSKFPIITWEKLWATIFKDRKHENICTYVWVYIYVKLPHLYVQIGPLHVQMAI